MKLTSVKTQLPYEFYRAPFCEPEGGIEYKSENLGKHCIFNFSMDLPNLGPYVDPFPIIKISKNKIANNISIATSTLR